mmetsp:Transcript_25341/g.28347  ORF Transcript_25341/g.28347 Transcript_25341/m.28347 type:complete len:217 (-) Transcript_25341:234-884(-)
MVTFNSSKTTVLLAVTTVLAWSSTRTSASELQVDVYEGPTECDADQTVTSGNNLSMHYTGTIDQSSATGEKGKQFDSSRGQGQTFDFDIGVGRVIKGWDQGIVGLCVGAKANLIIPPELGYGENGAGGDIPGGATLHFDVEVVSINATPEQPNIFQQIDTDADGKIIPEEVGAYFTAQGQTMPDELFGKEDTNGDGHISWEEFSGPKGTNPLGDEL